MSARGYSISNGLVMLITDKYGGSEFWKYEGINKVTDLSLNILSKSIKSITLLMQGTLMKFLL